MKKCIRMGITVLKIVIWGGKSSVLWLQIAFYSSADALLWNEISDHKTDDLPLQMTILKSYPLNYHEIPNVDLSFWIIWTCLVLTKWWVAKFILIWRKCFSCSANRKVHSVIICNNSWPEKWCKLKFIEISCRHLLLSTSVSKYWKPFFFSSY